MRIFTKMKVMNLVALIIFSLNSYAQNVTVSGKVIDAGEDEGLVGATVLEKGTQNGVVTDIEGNYSIMVNDGATLIFSFVGYETKEIIVGNQSKIDVSMILDVKTLDEVVVVGYGTQRKSDLTGAVSIADAAEMQKVATNDVSQALQGRVAGVAVTSDGQPGAAPQVRIRGISTFGGLGASAEPLYVVDGVPVGGIRDINPNDIETMQVLKDATAGAIYGNRAANGVVIITTKRGEKGKPFSVELNAYTGVQKVYQEMPLLNRDQFQMINNELMTNAGAPLIPGNDPSSEFYINDIDTDWQDAGFKDGSISNVNVNFNGGSDNTTYYVSLDYLDNEGTLVGGGPDYKRYSARVNTQTEYGRVKFGENFLKMRSDEHPLFSTSTISLPGGRPSLVNDLLIAAPTIPVIDENRLGGFGGADATIHNSITLNVPGMNTLIDNSTVVDRTLINLWGEVEIIEGLSYRLNTSFDQTAIADQLFVPEYDLGYFFPNPTAVLQVRDRNSSTGLIENTLNFEKNFGQHSLKLLAGQSYQEDNYRENSTTGSGLQAPYVLNLTEAQSFSAGDFIDKAALYSFFGRLNYSFDDTYLITANLRRDGSSKFAEENRYELFPSVGLAWKVHNAIDLPAFISEMKLRGGVGQVGNQFVGSFNYSGTINRGIPYEFNTGRVFGAAVTASIDPSITWETRTTRSVGVDAVLLDGRFDLTFEYYSNTSDDILLELPIPLSVGSSARSTIVTNAGSMKNTGIEIAATFRQQLGDLTFEVSPNFYTLKNEILDLDILDNLAGTGTWNEVGRSLGEHYGWVYDGIFQDQTEIINHATQTPNTAPGDIRFKDIAGPEDENGNPTGPDGIIDNNDRTYLGQGMPTYYYGLNVTMGYKGLDFTFFGNGSGGNLINSNLYRGLMPTTGFTNWHEDILDRWTPTNTNTDVPRVVWQDPNNNQRDSDRPGWLQKGDYFRINTVSLGYTLPSNLVDAISASSVRFYVTIQNLAVFSKYDGFNPDFTSQVPNFGNSGTNPGLLNPGFDFGTFPRPRTTMVGVQIKF